MEGVKMVKFGYDISNNIIGYLIFTGRCFYDGRQQGKDFFASTAKQIEKICRQKIKQLKRLHAGCYNDNKLWEIKIY